MNDLNTNEIYYWLLNSGNTSDPEINDRLRFCKRYISTFPDTHRAVCCESRALLDPYYRGDHE